MILKTKSSEPINYQVGWLAAIFAPQTDYHAFSLTHDGVILSGHKGGLNKVSYFVILASVIIDSEGIFSLGEL